MSVAPPLIFLLAQTKGHIHLVGVTARVLVGRETDRQEGRNHSAMSLRRKYPNNKEGRKQRRIAEAACALADTRDAEEAETKKRKAANAAESPAAAEGKVTRIMAKFAVVPYIKTGEHALALYDVAEARLKSNMKFMSEAELLECTARFSIMLDELRSERTCRGFKRKTEDGSRTWTETVKITQ